MQLQSKTERGSVEPLQLSEGRVYAAKEIVRLEFRSAVSQPFPVEAAPSSSTVVEEKAGITVEVDVLREKLRSQQEEFQREIEETRRSAMEIVRAECREEIEREIATERERIARVMIQFGRERANYFASAEAEVIKLSLAIAARVLHREVRLDPLLLKGVVRVALERVEEDSAVVLRVPESAVERWRQELADGRDLMPKILGDCQLSDGDCVLESSVGNANLGVSAQLEEVERGFFDLLAKRPA